MLSRHRAFGLLGSLVLLVVVPIAGGGQERGAITEWVVLALFTLVFLAGLYAISSDARMRAVGKILLVPLFLAQLAKPLGDARVTDIVGRMSAVCALAFLLWGLVRYFLRARVVTLDMLARVVSGYFLLGVLWALVFQLLLDIFPGSFTHSHESMFYLSFVTITTLGYGDVLPQLPVARAAIVCATLSGQLYLAIMVALIVGKLISGGEAGITDDSSAS